MQTRPDDKRTSHSAISQTRRGKTEQWFEFGGRDRYFRCIGLQMDGIQALGEQVQKTVDDGLSSVGKGN